MVFGFSRTLLGGIRQVSNRGHTFQVLGKALSCPTSRYLCGYWQGNKPPDLIWEG